MSWEDIIKRRALVNHSNNNKWDRLSGLISSVDTQLLTLRRVKTGKRERQDDISVAEIENKWLDKINNNLMKFAYELEAHKNKMDKPKPKTKFMPIAPTATMTPPTQAGEEQTLDDTVANVHERQSLEGKYR